jgi:hypothetical protein
MTEQQAAFWDTIEVFENNGLLPYVMLIGSWAEYIYQHHLISGFTANLRTRDVDFFYPNLSRPRNRDIRIIKSLSEKGFIYAEDRLSGVGKFFKGDLLELEFITRDLGKGQSVYEIPSLNIRAEGLRTVNMLAEYPLQLDCNGFIITKPDEKKEKDVQAVRELVKFVDKDRMRQIYDKLSNKEKQKVDSVCKANFINI